MSTSSAKMNGTDGKKLVLIVAVRRYFRTEVF